MHFHGSIANEEWTAAKEPMEIIARWAVGGDIICTVSLLPHDTIEQLRYSIATSAQENSSMLRLLSADAPLALDMRLDAAGLSTGAVVAVIKSPDPEEFLIIFPGHWGAILPTCRNTPFPAMPGVDYTNASLATQLTEAAAPEASYAFRRRAVFSAVQTAHRRQSLIHEEINEAHCIRVRGRDDLGVVIPGAFEGPLWGEDYERRRRTVDFALKAATDREDRLQELIVNGPGICIGSMLPWPGMPTVDARWTEGSEMVGLEICKKCEAPTWRREVLLARQYLSRLGIDWSFSDTLDVLKSKVFRKNGAACGAKVFQANHSNFSSPPTIESLLADILGLNPHVTEGQLKKYLDVYDITDSDDPANPVRIIGWNLSGLKLRALPEEFGQLTVEKNLYIDRNHLTGLPPDFCNVRVAGHLGLRENMLASLSDTVWSSRLRANVGGTLFLDKQLDKPWEEPQKSEAGQALEEGLQKTGLLYCCLQ